MGAVPGPAAEAVGGMCGPHETAPAALPWEVCLPAHTDTFPIHFVPILRRDTSHPDPLQALRDIMRQQVQVILWSSSSVFRLLYA